MSIYEEFTNYSKHNNVDFLFCDFANTPIVEKFFQLFNTFSYCPSVFSLIGSCLVGLSGIFPLLVIPIEEGENLKFGVLTPLLGYWSIMNYTIRSIMSIDERLCKLCMGLWLFPYALSAGTTTLLCLCLFKTRNGANRLRVLLSFAVGGLLGDVFLHLLPEVWGLSSGHQSHPSLFSGIWVLIGMLVFIIVEKLSSSLGTDESSNFVVETIKANCSDIVSDKDIPIPLRRKVSLVCINNNLKYPPGKTPEAKEHYHISGYLNLMANSVDNFTHGLTIGGSFAISFKMGVLSTFAILIHELPHEIGDFAILLKSGFSRWDAAKAQIFTASAGVMGSMIAITFGSIESRASWILPFTAGGFLHIALVTVLPDLVHEESKFESCKQLGSLFFGIAVMAFLVMVFE